MAFELDPALLTGHPTIDAQHRELIARILRLLDAMKEGRGRAELAPVVQYLGAYVVEHFGTEESIMRARRYPELAAHLAEHQKFEAELAKIRADLERDGPGTLLVIRVNHQLLDWLKNHIHVRDRALAAWLAASRPATHAG
ncbi:MAG TPA: bacteriohemerythrin [Anaeromyxobacteraceae bacterium]|nr:bacteriohemerythrin [Anaeromyxobacteraceae bacterium]